MKPRIRLVIDRPDGRRSDVVIDGDPITAEMLAAAEDLLHTLTTGERPPPEGLYDLCAIAFGTTREDAKRRLTGAAYGGKDLIVLAAPPARRRFVPAWLWFSSPSKIRHAFADGDDWSLCGMARRERAVAIKVSDHTVYEECGHCVRCDKARASQEDPS